MACDIYIYMCKDSRLLPREWSVVLAIDASGGNAYKSLLHRLCS